MPKATLVVCFALLSFLLIVSWGALQSIAITINQHPIYTVYTKRLLQYTHCKTGKIRVQNILCDFSSIKVVLQIINVYPLLLFVEISYIKFPC